MSPIGQPYRGDARPIIVQHGDTLAMTDRGDIFTQEGQRPNRTAVQWERQVGGGGWEVIPPHGPDAKRTDWDTVLPSERNDTLKIGAENVGRKFRVLVYGGYGPSPGGNVGTPEHDQLYVEWGASDGDHRDDDRPSDRSYSEVLTVAPWGQTPPPQEKPWTAADAKARMIGVAKFWERTNTAPLSRITLARRILELPDNGHPGWLDVREAVKALLDDPGEGR